MQNPQRPARRPRSAFAAAFLSFLFPGLGQVYSGALSRGLAFAAAPFLAIALLGGIVLRGDRLGLLGFVIQQPVLIALLVLNAVALVYRLVAVIDAWQVARYVNSYESSGDGRLGRSRLPLSPLSVAGLAATVLILAGGHVAVARYNVLALDLVGCVFSDSTASSCDFPTASSGPDTSAGASGSAAPGESVTSSGEAPVGSAGGGTPAPTLPPWNGTDRLNILLVGVDQRAGDSTFNTDTMIVVSIDPVSKQVAMFQLPRDTVGVPVPPSAQAAWGQTFSCTTCKINNWWRFNMNRGDLWPGSNSTTRGANALKAILGNLYGLQIPYYVMVNFTGFQRAVDALGGVTINVQIPVVDNLYPGGFGNMRVYIPAGPQVMDGYDALVYARSRHGSSDFDRGRRQQRVLLSIHDEVNPQTILANLPTLVDTLQRSVKTDIPQSMIESLLSLSSEVDTKNLRSYVFGPPYFETDMWGPSGGTNSDIVIHADRIKQAVSTAFTLDPKLQAQQEALAAELAQVYVLNGSGRTGLGTSLSDYLAYAGLDASAPNQVTKTIATSTIVVYNGAELKLPKTIAYLESVFGVQVTTATDSTVPVDIVITAGKNAPTLTIEAPG